MAMVEMLLVGQKRPNEANFKLYFMFKCNFYYVSVKSCEVYRTLVFVFQKVIIESQKQTQTQWMATLPFPLLSPKILYLIFVSSLPPTPTSEPSATFQNRSCLATSHHCLCHHSALCTYTESLLLLPTWSPCCCPHPLQPSLNII